MSVSKEINKCFLKLDILRKIDNSKLSELLDYYIINFNSIYIEKIYNIINYNNNTKYVYKFIRNYILQSRKKIINCIKKK